MSFKHLFFVCIGMSFFVHTSSGQQFKMSQGVTLTDYVFKNDQGLQSLDLRAATGIATQVSFHKASLYDSLSSKLEQTKLAIYLSKNPFAAKLLSKLNYDLGIQYSQMNAVGDVQRNTFSYQTDFLGLQGKVGLRIKLPFQFSVNLQGIAGAQKMLYGTQFVNNQYRDLGKDMQFSNVKIMLGFGGELERSFSDRLVGIFAYQQTQTINQSAVDQSTLSFKPVIFSMGFRFAN